MKFTIPWLKEHLDTECSSEEILEKLNMIGLEVESFNNPKKLYEDFSVCEVLSVEKHPDADKLNKCLLNTKNSHIEVICGANNVRVGMKAVFAPVGAYIPGLDIYLKSTKIRGIQSNGMLVSEKELLLSDEHDGIIELDNKAEVGLSIDNFFDLGDEVIEIGVTPNRSDALGVNGIARDLSASGIGSIKQSVINEVKEKIICDKSFFIDPILGKEENITASFRLIKNVNNVESPKWLKDRLKSIGLRPISSLVDITNYLTFDSCRPLHVFDADKIGKDIYIRKATSEEKILALDDNQYNLDTSVTVIADEQG
ncbi:phenylalanine--tRNA ligase subunit beta, partial [Hyphomicrobiales bacterium]|nr:phenylalanine--tRNA ligase subunit beta [Hyphomicrobiales bacterium]